MLNDSSLPHRHPCVKRPSLWRDMGWGGEGGREEVALNQARAVSCFGAPRCPRQQCEIPDRRAQLAGLLLAVPRVAATASSSSKMWSPPPFCRCEEPAPVCCVSCFRVLGAVSPVVGAWGGRFASLLGARLAAPRLRIWHRWIFGGVEELANVQPGGQEALSLQAPAIHILRNVNHWGLAVFRTSVPTNSRGCAH